MAQAVADSVLYCLKNSTLKCFFFPSDTTMPQSAYISNLIHDKYTMMFSRWKMRCTLPQISSRYKLPVPSLCIISAVHFEDFKVEELEKFSRQQKIDIYKEARLKQVWEIRASLSVYNNENGLVSVL